jgi:hypothetical protein
MDAIPNTKDVMFVGDYFTLITSVQLEERLREKDESDEDFAIRLASVWLGEYYGWDVLKASNEVGVVERGDAEEEDG